MEEKRYRKIRFHFPNGTGWKADIVDADTGEPTGWAIKSLSIRPIYGDEIITAKVEIWVDDLDVVAYVEREDAKFISFEEEMERLRAASKQELRWLSTI